MNTYRKLTKLAKRNNGIITTKDMKRLGYHREYLSKLLHEGKIERVERGVYVLIDYFDDELYNIQQRYAKGIYSHGTALHLFGLTDRTPIKYTLTFPSSYNITNVKKHNLNVHRVSSKYYCLGKTVVKTKFGNSVYVYSRERTLCDICRKHSKTDIETITTAFKEYASLKKNQKNINELYLISKKLRVEKIVRNYMEVLL